MAVLWKNPPCLSIFIIRTCMENLNFTNRTMEKYGKSPCYSWENSRFPWPFSNSYMWFQKDYPLVISRKTMERSTIFYGKLTFSKKQRIVTNYQRVVMIVIDTAAAVGRWAKSWFHPTLLPVFKSQFYQEYPPSNPPESKFLVYQKHRYLPLGIGLLVNHQDGCWRTQCIFRYSRNLH